jgi:hypothetical protein
MATKHDVLASRTRLAVLYGLPVAAITAVGMMGVDSGTAGIVWAAALGVMGTACLWNAARCGRVHCYFTGPFFLAMGLLALLHGFGILSLGPTGWYWLGNVLLLGGLSLAIIPERIWGRYRTRR